MRARAADAYTPDRDPPVEERHASNDRQFRAVFVEAADPMFLLDSARRIVEANRAALHLLGVEAEALAGLTFEGFLAERTSDLEAGWREMLAFGESRREHRVQPIDRGERIVECSYRASVHQDLHLCIARDVTERRQFEERVLQSEKIESVGRLAGGIAHDFNNLLTAILGYTELLLTTRDFDPAARADLTEILKAAQRATSLTQKLLAYGRKQVLQPRTVNLGQVVCELREMLRRVIREDITIHFDLPAVPAFVQVDPAQIEQVILNLVLNARDALPAGGAVRIEVRSIRRHAAGLPAEALHQEHGYVRLRVSDNGMGIPDHVRDHLFEPFFTTKEVGKGTGLGLASVYGIVRQSQGYISVESQPGHGATFTMHFPAVPAPVDEDGEVARVDTPAAPAGHTVLVVEDEPSVRRIAATVLERQGHRVITADSPRAACELFAAHGRDIHLLVTDVVMPGMNGPALAQHLVAARPGLKVLLMSGHAAPSPAGESGRHVGFLLKPFQPAELAAAVHDLLTAGEGD